MKNRSILMVHLMLIACIISFAQPGTLDGDFDADGKVITPITNVDDYARSVIIQPDLKILVAGLSGFDGTGENSNFTVVRYNTDGSIDNSFGDNGIVITDLGRQDFGMSMVLQSDGRIIVGGTSNAFTSINTFAIVRYNQDGILDNSFSTFNSNGLFMGPLGDCQAIALQEDGKILAAGTVNIASDDFIVARYNNDGTIDASFGVNGVVTTDIGGDSDRARSIAIQGDGKMIVAGSSNNGEDFDFAMVRYNPDGSLDNSFSVNGMVTSAIGNTHDFGYEVIIQPDGKIVVAGSSYGAGTEPDKIAVVRYNSNGTLDNSFSADGKATTSNDGERCYGNSVVLQADGKLVVAGSGDEEFIIVRFNEDGVLDNTFDTDGIVTTQVGVVSGASCCAIQPDGRIVAAGSGNTGIGPEFGLARYISGSNLGIISFFKQDHGLLIYPNPLQENTTIEYSLIKDEIINIDLFDISGNRVQSLVRAEKRSKGEHKETLNLDTFMPSGTYILTISNGAGSSSIRVVK